MRESCHICEWAMSRIWMCRVTQKMGSFVHTWMSWTRCHERMCTLRRCTYIHCYNIRMGSLVALKYQKFEITNSIILRARTDVKSPRALRICSRVVFTSHELGHLNCINWFTFHELDHLIPTKWLVQGVYAGYEEGTLVNMLFCHMHFSRTQSSQFHELTFGWSDL